MNLNLGETVRLGTNVANKIPFPFAFGRSVCPVEAS